MEEFVQEFRRVARESCYDISLSDKTKITSILSNIRKLDRVSSTR